MESNTKLSKRLGRPTKWLAEDRREVFMRYLEGYLSHKKNRIKAVVELFDCSPSTARDLTNRKTTMRRKIRMEWACILLRRMNRPITRVTGKSSKSFEDVMMGWIGIPEGPESIEAVHDLSVAACNWAGICYDLHSKSEITSAPLSAQGLCIEFSSLPIDKKDEDRCPPHKLVFYVAMLTNTMRVTHKIPAYEGRRADAQDFLLSTETMRHILVTIDELTKNYVPAEIA